MFQRMIVYNRTTHDFAMYLGGTLIGYTQSMPEAQAVLDQFMLELLRTRSGKRVA